MSRPVARTVSSRDRLSSSVILLACALLAAVLVAALTGTRPARAAEAAKETTSAKKAATAKAKAPVDSLARLEAAVKKDSTNARNQYRLGVAYLDKDRPQEAVRAFYAATKSKPDYVEAWVNLGAAHDAIGHGAMARDAYTQALALRPDDEIALCRMASSFYAVGMKDSAMAVLRHTITKHPRSHCSYFTLGVGFADGGMFREAIAAWNKVVEFAPGSPEAESAKESVRLLKEYLGKDSVRVASTNPPGVLPGSGGPGEPLKGGEMNAKPVPSGHTAGDGHKH